MTIYTQNIHDTLSSLDALALLELDIVSGLTVYDTTNAAKWYLSGNVQPGAAQFSDRSYAFSTIPAILLGAEWVETPIGSRTFSGNPLVTFNVTQATTIYVVMDSRAAKPGWMDTTWSNSGLVITDSQSPGFNTFLPWVKTFTPGQVSLGYNTPTGATNVNMYTVMLLPSSYSYSLLVADTQSGLDTPPLKLMSRPLFDQTSATDAFSHVWSAHLALSEAISNSDSLQKSLRRVILDSFADIDVISTSKTGVMAWQQTISDSFSSTDAIAWWTLTKLLGETLSGVDGLTKRVMAPLYDVFSGQDTLFRQLQRQIQDTVSQTDTVSTARALFLQLLDAFSLTDVPFETYTKVQNGQLVLAMSLIASAFGLTVNFTNSQLLGMSLSLLPTPFALGVSLQNTLALTPTLLPSPFAESFYLF